MADQPSSRRSFLFGRSLRQEDPWLRFLARLKRSCEGQIGLLKRDGAALARLEPARLEDVLHARTLCQEHGVRMILDGVPLAEVEQHVPVLLVEAGQAWASASPIADNLWRVDAGCPLPVMRAMGIQISHERDQTTVPVQNFAQWLALLQVTADIGGLERYGVQAIECLYPDGSIETLGQFGVKDSQPLRSLAAQRSIPALFQLSMDPRLQQLLQQLPAGQWPLSYRLDALMGTAGANVNLAHLFLGHRASLAWVIAAHVSADTLALSGDDQRNTVAIKVPEWRRQCREIDLSVKQVMDPTGLYMSTPA